MVQEVIKLHCERKNTICVNLKWKKRTFIICSYLWSFLSRGGFLRRHWEYYLYLIGGGKGAMDCGCDYFLKTICFDLRFLVLIVSLSMSNMNEVLLWLFEALTLNNGLRLFRFVYAMRLIYFKVIGWNLCGIFSFILCFMLFGFF